MDQLGFLTIGYGHLILPGEKDLTEKNRRGSSETTGAVFKRNKAAILLSHKTLERMSSERKLHIFEKAKLFIENNTHEG